MPQKPRNYLYRSFWLLLVAVLLAVGGSRLLSRQSLFASWDIKPFNPLSDLFSPTEQTLEAPELSAILLEDSLPSTPPSEVELPAEPTDTLATATPPDTIPHRATPITSGGLSDYTASGDAVRQIRAGLASGRYYVAMLGDSFIEGDIFVGPLRDALQQRYGGKGVGYVALTSKTARFRQSVQHRFQGKWQSSDLNHRRKGIRYTITEQVDAASKGSEATYTMIPKPQNLAQVDYATLLYQADTTVLLSYQINDLARDTITLPAQKGKLHRHTFRHPEGVRSLSFKIEGDTAPADSLLFHGIFLDGAEGVTVDNLSLRGASGAQVTHIAPALNRQMQSLRPYQLIILQYGINVIDPEKPEDHYGWYYRQMERSLQHLQSLYPDALFIICSVSDRASRLEGSIQTLPAVGYIWKHQQRLAQQYGCLFWDTLGTMKRAGGIAGFVQRGQAAKDYTHLNFAGGRTLAKAFLYDLLEAPLGENEDSNVEKSAAVEQSSREGTSQSKQQVEIVEDAKPKP